MTTNPSELLANIRHAVNHSAHVALMEEALRAVVDLCDNGRAPHLAQIPVDALLTVVAEKLCLDTDPVWHVGSIADVDRARIRAVAEYVISKQWSAASTIERHLGYGFREVADALEKLEQWGLVGPSYGSLARKVLVPASELEAVLAEIDNAPVAPADGQP